MKSMKVDFVAKTITITAECAERMNDPNSTEYKAIRQLCADFPSMIPNRYWYQLNGQSAQANWLEQREAIYSRIQEQEEEVIPQIIFTSEVKIR